MHCFRWEQTGHVRRRPKKKVEAESIGLTLQKVVMLVVSFCLPTDSVVLAREQEQHRERFRSRYIRYRKVLNFALS